MIDLMILLILMMAALQDYKEHVICDWQILSVGILGVMAQWIEGHLTLAQLLCSASLGVAMWMLARLTREKIGAGDGMMILALGLGMGLEKSLYMVGIASLLMVPWALYAKIKKTSKELPFVPALLGGYLICII